MGVDAQRRYRLRLLFNLGTKVVAVFTHMKRRTIQPKLLFVALYRRRSGRDSRAFSQAPICAITSTSPLSNTSCASCSGIALLVSAVSIAFGKGLVTDVSRMQQADVVPRVRLVLIGAFRRHPGEPDI